MLTSSEFEELQHLKSIVAGVQMGIEKILEKNIAADPKPRKRQNLKDKRVEKFREQYASGKWQQKSKIK